MQLQQIAERCQQGDREAFALLYTATREQLRGVCLRYVHDETVADDLLHDAFLLIINKMSELKDTARVGVWLKAVMRNVALLYLRQQKQQQEVSFSSCTARSLQQPAENNRAETTLAMQEIMAAVDALPDGYRRVFRLSVVEGLSHQEIASLLRIEPHSSSSQLFHAKVLLRRWLRPLVLLLLAVAVPLGVWWRSTVNEDSPYGVDGRGASAPPPEETVMAAPEIREEEQAVAAVARPTGGGAGGEVGSTTIDDAQETNDVADAETPPLDPPLDEPDISLEKKAIALDQEMTVKPAATRHDHPWTIEMAYSATGDNGSNMQLPRADAYTNPVVSDSSASHHFPLTVSLAVERRIGQHWQVGTGLSWSRLKSDFSIGNSYISRRQQQTVQYLGLPLSASYHWSPARHLQLYAKASVTLHLPLRSSRNSYYLMPDGHREESITERLHPGLQLSAGMAVGLQVQLTPHVSLFAEPGVQHFFSSGNGVSTWYTEHPFAPSLPLGLKISF